MDKKKSLSYIWFSLSMLIFGTIGIFRRFIPLSSSLLAIFRGFIGVAILLLIIKLKGEKILIPVEKKKLVFPILAGCAIGINWIFLFESLRYTTVPITTLCVYMEPTFIMLVSPIIFKEKLTPKKLICAFLALVGMVFVSGILEGNGISSSDILGIVLGLGCAVFYTASAILNKFAKTEKPLHQTALELFVSALVCIPYMLMSGDYGTLDGSWQTVGLVIYVGIVNTALAYFLFFTGIKGISGQTVSALSYIDPVASILLSALILQEYLTPFGIVGAVLIIGSALVCEVDFIALFKKIFHKNQSQNSAEKEA